LEILSADFMDVGVGRRRTMTPGTALSSSSTEMLNPAEDCGNPVSFRSILFARTEAAADLDKQEAPEFFKDLNLDQIVESITAGREEYNLKPLFHIALGDVETVNYRHDILRDLENQKLVGCIRSFAEEMRKMRSHLARAKKLYYELQKQRWFLDAVEIYCDAVRQLSKDLSFIDLRSRGLLGFREYLAGHVKSDDFVSLLAETQRLKSDLSGIRYSLHIEGKRIKVLKCANEPDYSADVLQTFEKFKQGAPKEYPFEFPDSPDMNHVEAAILDLVAQLYSETFSSLSDYCTRHSGYLNSTIATFDREVQFYLAYLEHIEQFKQAGLPFCYPVVTDQSKEVHGYDVFDLALATRLVKENTPVVTNDFHLKDPERVIVVSGPNQGGKTTFARTFGQLHFLAGIGCPVPGRDATLFLFDNLFTHFEREEDIRNLSGKLEDDLLRIHRIFERATPNSILVMNESFLSTTLNDALFLSKQIMQRIIALDLLCVSVTFLDELASVSETTVSMVSTVNPRDPALRTFKIVRRPADGLAYAAAIAEKYRLTYRSVKNRIAENAPGRVRA
jgi:DNA mismatch repair protein MutS